ncbi:MAG: membrane protein insertase YidC [Candidatus Acetothermia bacterium]|jgi:YidC/Oxa1 family membrane protein insertase|nr:membrane protein insertase YidC [Candidatus Acetothermia bacterium]MDH7505282.1 membrane protein insertase YidC [Candidatus Acetothermia bacterium]
MQRIALGSAILLLASLVLAGTMALGAEDSRRIELQESEREGYREIEVRTGLADYLFSTENGELRSAFLHFAPYGLRKQELVVDTTTDPTTLARSYTPGGVFPFTLQLAGLEGPWEYRLLKQEAREVQLEFAKAVGALQLKRIYTIRDDPSYTVDLDLVLRNQGGGELSLEGFKLLLGTDQFQLVVGKFVTGEVRYLFDGKRAETVPPSYERFDGLGVVTKVLVLFLKSRAAGQGKPLAPSVELDERGRKLLGVRTGELKLAPGEERTFGFTLYAGRPKWALLQLSGLEAVVDVGAFGWALVGIVRFLDWLYAATGNYGWAIILFTIVVRLLLFPLMRKQYYSMARMQRLQPKLQQLQQRYKQDKKLLQKKMMELYQKEGINPLSGCLPLLIQFPILYVLWQAILYSAERVHLSPGFLWMADLSVADPYYIIVALNVLAMILQSLLSTPTTGQKPNWLLTLGMPVFMGIFLRNFPAGMWLYWLLTTIVQLGQQWLINREVARLAPVPLEATEQLLAEKAEGNGDEARS